MKHERTVILTATEKRTALIGKQFCRRQGAHVDLAGAVCREANLEGVRFVQTEWQDADFRHAHLRGAAFFLCDLHGADVTDACVEQTTFRRSVGVSSAIRTDIYLHGGVVEDGSRKGSGMQKAHRLRIPMRKGHLLV